jgi:hypothetical protein
MIRGFSVGGCSSVLFDDVESDSSCFGGGSTAGGDGNGVIAERGSTADLDRHCGRARPSDGGGAEGYGLTVALAGCRERYHSAEAAGAGDRDCRGTGGIPSDGDGRGIC